MTKSVEDIIEAIDQLDELSNKTLKNYLKHTSETPPKDKYGDLMSGGAAYRAGKTSGDIENPDNLDRKNRNRIRDNQERGRDQASDRIKARETGSAHLDAPHAYSKQGQKYHAELAALKRKHGIDENVIDIIEAIDQLDELSKETLTSYIDKAKDARQKYVGTSVAADLSDGIKKATKKLSNKKLTKESIESLVSAVLDGDQESASAAFSQAMGEKLTDKMDTMKIEIAGSIGEAVYEKDMDEKKPIYAEGVKGMKSKPFKKKFKSMDHYNKWADTEDFGNHEVHRVYQA